MIKLKRVYEPAARTDGLRILVDRLWPRGIAKADLNLDEWMKDLAPSNELRRWFAHKPEKWAEFLSRYFKELDDKEQEWMPLLQQAKGRRITLLYAAKDSEHNNAEALRQYLETKQQASEHAS